MRFTVISFLILTLCLSLFFVPSKSYACSCIQPAPPNEELERYSAVFSGKVMEIKETKNLLQSSASPIAVRFEVDKSWKGVKKKEVIVHTAMSSASCGYNFKENENYFVYANKHEGELVTTICSRTTTLSSASEDIKALGEGKLIKIEEETTEEKKPLVEGDSHVEDRIPENEVESKKQVENTNSLFLYSIALIIPLMTILLISMQNKK